MTLPDRLAASRTGLALVGLALVVYVLSNPFRSNAYDHFVWQADAFLHGRALIEWPVITETIRNDYFRDIQPDPAHPGFGWMPYPPLPAVLLLPVVAILGLATDQSFLATIVGALNVGLAWRLATRLTRDDGVASVAAIFYGFGTVAWYAAAIGSTWYFAHLVASTALFLGITAAIDARRARDSVVAGALFGLGTLARLTTVLGAPFFALVGAPVGLVRRTLLAGTGIAIPVAILFAYNMVTTGELFHPAYEYAYRTEAPGRPDLFRPEWAAEDPRYIPQNLVIMLAWLPTIRPECGVTAIVDVTCPFISPDPLGMSLLLTSPGYLLALGLLRRPRRDEDSAPTPALSPERERQLVVGALLASGAIALADLAHFSQGWVQFGYRFSNDFAPFLMIPVVLGIDRLGLGRAVVTPIAASILVNAWGLAWGVALRW